LAARGGEARLGWVRVSVLEWLAKGAHQFARLPIDRLLALRVTRVKFPLFPLHAPPPVRQARVPRHLVERDQPADLRVAAGEEETDRFALAEGDLFFQAENGDREAAGSDCPAAAGEGVAGGEEEVGGEPAEALDGDGREFRPVRSLLADQRFVAQAALSRCRGWPVATPPLSRATCGNCSATSGV
jgi:hypothetical protein